MRFVAAVWQWAGSSNDRAVDNAREASTALSRLRVEREEVELYLAGRYATVRQGAHRAVTADVRVAGEPR